MLAALMATERLTGDFSPANARSTAAHITARARSESNATPWSLHHWRTTSLTVWRSSSSKGIKLRSGGVPVLSSQARAPIISQAVFAVK